MVRGEDGSKACIKREVKSESRGYAALLAVWFFSSGCARPVMKDVPLGSLPEFMARAHCAIDAGAMVYFSDECIELNWRIRKDLEDDLGCIDDGGCEAYYGLPVAPYCVAEAKRPDQHMARSRLYAQKCSLCGPWDIFGPGECRARCVNHRCVVEPQQEPVPPLVAGCTPGGDGGSGLGAQAPRTPPGGPGPSRDAESDRVGDEPSSRAVPDGGPADWYVKSELPPWPCNVGKASWKPRLLDVHVSAGDCRVSVAPPNELGQCPLDWSESEMSLSHMVIPATHLVSTIGPDEDPIICGRRWHCGCDGE